MTASDAFDGEMRRSAPHLGVRAERPDDRDFLRAQFIACSPLTGLAPDAIVAQQAEFQHAAHRSAYPHAMRRIATLDDRPVGRIVVDWRDAETHLVDVAVRPEDRVTRAGRHMLRAWLTVADARGMAATLQVRADNPSLRLYTDLGFVVSAATGAYEPVIDMHRAAPSTIALGDRISECSGSIQVGGTLR